MTNKHITDFPKISGLTNNTLVHISKGGVDKNITLINFFDSLTKGALDGTNVGVGQELFISKSTNILRFRTLKSTHIGMEIVETEDEITLELFPEYLSGLNEFRSLPSASGAINLDCEDGLVDTFLVAPSADITSITFSNVPNGANEAYAVHIIIDSDATVRTITWPASIKWDEGNEPVLTPSTKTHVVALTIDGGTRFDAGYTG